MAKHHGTLGGKDRLRTFNRAVARVEALTQPVEVTGPPGTVVFWHQRLVHTAGINTLTDHSSRHFMRFQKRTLPPPPQIVRRRIYGEHGHLA